MKEIEITLKWENELSFEMTEKKDGGEVLSVIKIEENSDIGSIWKNITAICNSVWVGYMRRIGGEMKQ